MVVWLVATIFSCSSGYSTHTYVLSSAMFGGELWGVHPRAAGKCKKTAARYAWLLQKFAVLGCKTPTEPFLLDLSCDGCLLKIVGSRVLCAFVTSWWLFRRMICTGTDVLFDSVTTGTGFARGLQRICSAVGYDLVLHPDQPRLHRLDCAAIMQLGRQQDLAAMEDAAEIDPRTCTSTGACTYWRWFRRSKMQQRERRRHLTFIISLPASASKVSRLLRFRLGCQILLPVVSGWYRQVLRRPQRLCRHCPANCVGNEKHLIFECSALDHFRLKFSVHFLVHHSVRSFMNQVSQRAVLHFVCDCFTYYILLTNVGVADAQYNNDMDRGIDCWACWRIPSTHPTGRWRHAAPCSSSNGAVRSKDNPYGSGGSIMHVIFAAFATPQLYSALFGS